MPEIPGDGIVTIVHPSGEDKEKQMAESIDLPPNVAQQVLTDSLKRHERQMEETLGNINSVNNLVRHSGFRKFDELDTVEGRAVSGVNATPLGSPVTQSGS